MTFVEVYYLILFGLSAIFAAIYFLMWHRHFSVYLSLIFAFAPIQNMGYVCLTQSKTIGEVYMATVILYLGACFIILFITLAIFDLCKIHIPKFIKSAAFISSLTIFIFVLMLGKNPFFYKDLRIEWVDGVLVLHKSYGPVHTIHYALIVLYLISSFAAIIYSYIKKNEVSRKIIWLMFIIEAFSIFCFFGGRLITKKIEFTPLGYVFGLFIFLLIVHKICLYDISETAIDSITETGSTGFMSFDFKMHYLGSNQTAANVFEEINELTVDKSVEKSKTLGTLIKPWLETFASDQTKDKFYYRKDGKVFLVNINFLYDSNKKKGYQLVITDDTVNQKFLAEREKFNALLHQIFPDAIVHRLAENPNATIAESHSQVTVLFSDFAGFTKSTSGKDPKLVVEALDTIIRRFDALCKKYGVEKIKTIGDSYMAACGVPKAIDSHADRMILFAKEMYKTLNDYNKTAKIPFKMRIGLNSGPLVAGKISLNKPIYDLWGDTVNVASRMEGLCTEGKILISDDTYKALKYKNKFTFAPPEVKPVKGKGDMTVWEVE